MNAFDVRIHAIRRRPDRRRPFEVRWHAAGRPRSRSFITRGLADSYRAELIRAARKGLDFSPGTGEPASWAAPEAGGTNYQHRFAVLDFDPEKRAAHRSITTRTNQLVVHSLEEWQFRWIDTRRL